MKTLEEFQRVADIYREYVGVGNRVKIMFPFKNEQLGSAYAHAHWKGRHRGRICIKKWVLDQPLRFQLALLIHELIHLTFRSPHRHGQRFTSKEELWYSDFPDRFSD